MLRQLIALGHLRTEGEYNTLEPTPSARAVLRGEVTLLLRVAAEAKARQRRQPGAPRAPGRAAPADLDGAGQARFDALKAWRTEVARAHNLPPYVVFHDATLAEMARRVPRTLDELAGVSGVGEKKLQAYGEEILRVLGAPVA